MKFFYITDSVLDKRTAQTVHVDEMCAHLSQLGHEVTLYAPRIKQFKTPSNYFLKLLFVPVPMMSVFYQVRLLLALCRDMLKNKPDVLYTRHNLLLFVPNLVGKIFGIPVLLEVNGKLIEEAQHQKMGLQCRLLLGVGIFASAERFNFRCAAKIIVVTEGIKEYLIQCYRVEPEKIEVISNGVDTTFFSPQSKADAAQKVGLDPKSFYVGYIGSFFKWQGLCYVVESARLLKSIGEDIQFLIVGAGDEGDALKSFVKKHGLEDMVTIHPSVPRELVPSFISAFDICLCTPTRFRDGSTSPFKVYEYLSSERSVIVSSIRGMREEFGNVVHYIEPESAESLAEAIIFLKENNVERERLSREGRQFVLGGRCWTSVANMVASIACASCSKTTKQFSSEETRT